MRAAIVTAAASADKPNEDYAAASSTSAVVLDGSTWPDGVESGCIHGVAWYSRQLGAALLAELDDPAQAAISDCLARAILHVNGLHAHTCDLGHDGVPSATVVAVRQRRSVLEYLVLADSTLVLDGGEAEPVTVTDDREKYAGKPLRYLMDPYPAGTPEHAEGHSAYIQQLSSLRNTPGGFWVANTDPEAAQQALVGSEPLARLRGVALLTDGATRIVDRFDLMTWREACDVLASHDGPAALIDRVRTAEDSDPDGKRWPRGKAYDDATALTCVFEK